jgi:hypothetical protein
MQHGRCRDCETVYDYLEFERCPSCGNFTGSAYGGVEILDGNGGPPVAAVAAPAQRAIPAMRVGDTAAPAPAAAATPSDRRRLELLREEYSLVERFIDGMDQRALTLKAWSVTVGVAGIAYGLTSDRHEILLLAAFATVMLWLVEALGRSFQGVYIVRAREIERAIADHSLVTETPGITAAWRRIWRPRAYGRYVAIMGWPHVFLPHVLIIGTAVCLYLALELPRFS